MRRIGLAKRLRRDASKGLLLHHGVGKGHAWERIVGDAIDMRGTGRALRSQTLSGHGLLLLLKSAMLVHLLHLELVNRVPCSSIGLSGRHETEGRVWICAIREETHVRRRLLLLT